MSPFHKKWQQELERELDMAKAFTGSKSALEKFFSGCTYRYVLYKQWNMTKMPPHMRFGIDVHDCIEMSIQGADKEKIEKKHKMQVIERTERALNWLEKSEYEVLDTEAKHFAPVTDDINVFGIIDLVARDRDGCPVLIDWKTSRSQWPVTKTVHGELLHIGSKSWQGPVYLTPPFEDKYFGGEWPTRMEYVIIPEHGTVQNVPYHINDADVVWLTTSLQMLKDANDNDTFPPNRGYQCGNCDFQKVCWEVVNWSRYYNAR